jgi:glutathione peroxidase
MRRNWLVSTMALVVLFSAIASGAETSKESSMSELPEFMNIPFATITGDTTSLSEFAGKTLLLVNVASKCGYTPQYEGLQKLYETYKDSGLVVIGFPANNFGGQEPGSNEEIAEFCTTKFSVTFPMMAKVSVKGEDKHPLFVELTEKSDHNGEIKWNFSKFLIDKNGTLVARYGSMTKPMSKKIIKAIEEIL